MSRHFWETEITYLKGVGPERARLLQKEVNIHTYYDLIQYFPRKYIDKTKVYKIRDLRGELANVRLSGKVLAVKVIRGKKSRRLTALFSDGSGEIELIWFKQVNWVQKSLPIGKPISLFGSIRQYGRKLQMSHPEFEAIGSEAQGKEAAKGSIAPQYPETEKLRKIGLDSKGFAKLIERVLEMAPGPLRENLPQALLHAERLPERNKAFRQIHFPEESRLAEEARYRFKFEEFFFFQLGLAQSKVVNQPKHKSEAFPIVGEYFNTFYNEHLPFELTGAQKRVLKEIRKDVMRPIQMNRLIQGDVGSGKTMVAFMAMLMALDNGFQSAIMAPTEILAEQHYHNMQKYGKPMKLRIALLTGSTKKKEREQLFRELKSGLIQILIGTHALLEDPVVFEKLGLAIIDEQHKFGVLQRAKLWKKAQYYPHNLLMSATPIPRTLALTLYGDVDVSVIDEMPPGRVPVITTVRMEGQRLEVFGFIRKALENGRQAYIVYPLVEESDKVDYLAATEGYEAISRAFPEYHIGIVHGRMKPEAKEFEMQRFKRKETQVLVATTVIEVGVDVPNATIMVIENSEKFGLSQLHQLRGRVGRGGGQAYCILMTGPKTSQIAQKRLRAMVSTHDGFKIAETDLQLRGPGDFLGTRQSGLPEFRLANIIEDAEILQRARAAAFQLLQQDPGLQQAENKPVKEYYNRYARQNSALGSVG